MRLPTFNQLRRLPRSLSSPRLTQAVQISTKGVSARGCTQTSRWSAPVLERRELEEVDARPLEQAREVEEVAAVEESTEQGALSLLAKGKPLPFRLRPYQLDCVEACLRALEGGGLRIGVSAPTGSGKTAIFTSLVERLPKIRHPYNSTVADRVLVLVGSIELALQAADSVRRRYPRLVVEIDQGVGHIASGEADVTVATYQTLTRGDYKRLKKFDPDRTKAVIVDEAHHAVTKSHLGILSYFNSQVMIPTDPMSSTFAPIEPSPIESFDSPSPSFLPLDPPPTPIVIGTMDNEGRPLVPILGFTATFTRADGVGLGKVFSQIVWHADWLAMIRSKWLSEVRFSMVTLGDALDMSEVKLNRDGEFQEKSLAQAVDQEQVTALAMEAWVEKASTRRSTLVFAINIEHIMSLTNAFRALGIDARPIHVGTTPSLRRSTLAAFRAQEFPVLVNCGILTEGADFPGIDCILLARPTRSKTLYLQMMGRGLRKSEKTGKIDCLVLDLVGNSTKGIVCAPTLFGIDPDTVIEAQSTAQLKQLAIDHPPPPPPSVAIESVVYDDYGSVFDLVESTSGQGSPVRTSVRDLSELAWVGCGEGVFVLEMLGKGHIKITPSENSSEKSYIAQLYRRGSAASSFAIRPRALATNTSLPLLIQFAENYIKHDPKYGTHNLSHYASWRYSRASTAQKSFIISTLCTDMEDLSGEIDGVWVGKALGTRFAVEDLGKGAAGDVISRWKHGGKGFLGKIERQRARENKARDKMLASA